MAFSNGHKLIDVYGEFDEKIPENWHAETKFNTPFFISAFWQVYPNLLKVY